MKYATVCSGIEAPSVAWHSLGWQPVFFSEIEKAPSRLLSHHYPNVPNLGDMNHINTQDYARTIDLVCGGTPCQSFSVAGLRQGMADPRGNLALVFLRLVDQIRPTWVLWENVPGVLSSNGGRDFGAFLGALGKLGYGFAYRVLDAQYFGVPQRRRRVFVVGHIGGQWQRCAAVLFESESMSGHFEAGGTARQRVAAEIEASIARSRKQTVAIDFRNNVFSELSMTIQAGGKGVSVNTIPHVMATGQAGAEIIAGKCRALTCNHEAPIVFDPNQVTSKHNRSNPKPNISHTLPAAITPPFLFQPSIARNGRGVPSEISAAITAHAGGKGDTQQCVVNGSGVRRITPLECERLQGFPDNYTNVCGLSDSARYKMLGNSMAVPVIKWIGERINKIHNSII